MSDSIAAHGNAATLANSATHADERVRATMTLGDPRLVAKIIHLGLRHGCTYTKLHVHRSGNSYETEIEFDGPEDGLRRLRTQLEKITHEETALRHHQDNTTFPNDDNTALRHDHDQTNLLNDKEIS